MKSLLEEDPTTLLGLEEDNDPTDLIGAEDDDEEDPRELLGSGVHGADDVMIARAAAKIAGQQDAQLLLVGRGVFAQMLGERHQHAGRAEAALQAMMIVKAFLQYGERAVRMGEPLDRLDAGAIRLHGEHQAGAQAAPIDQHGAGAANAVLAARMRAG